MISLPFGIRTKCSSLLKPKSSPSAPHLRKNIILNQKNVKYLVPTRTYHKSSYLEKKRIFQAPIGLPEADPKEPLIKIGEDHVPQDRLTNVIAHINEDPTLPLLEEPEIDLEPFLVNEILHIGRHTKILPGGRVMTFSAFVMIGTGDGTGGLGRGRGENVAQAVSVALSIAKKNLISIEMHRGCSVSHDATYKYKRTKVVVRACRTGYGIRASPEMRIALDAFGLRDICVVTVGRTTNRQALYRALFKGLQTDIRTIENLSKMLGKKYLDIHKFFYYKNE